tara:strand:- start:2337 stop:2495 length:159 start_codon:yes stop_codon:yes gene_type:complete
MDNQSGAQFAQNRAQDASSGAPAQTGENDELKAMVRQIVMEVLQEMQSGAQV